MGLLTVNSVDTKVGVFGASNPALAADWIDLVTTLPASAAVWDASESKCTGIVSAAHYEFMYVEGGGASNPTRRIVAAHVGYATESCQFASAMPAGKRAAD